MNAIRLIDILISLIAMVILFPVILFIGVILYVEHGSPFFIQKRVGKDKVVFTLIKFRSMSPKAANLPTHEISSDFITVTGKFIRASKLDELPQLWNVLVGDMSLVGPRPCLPTQEEVINEREALDVFRMRPGITGPSQVKNIDMSTPEILALEDSKILENLSVTSYFKYIFLTLSGHGQGDKVRN